KMKFVKVLLIVSCAIGATNLGAQSAAGVVHRSGARAGKSSIRKLTWLAGPGIVDLSDPFEPSLAVHGRSTLLAWPEELRTGVWRLWTASRTLPWQSWGDRVDVDNSAQPWLTRMMTGPDGLTSLAWGRRDNSRQESVMVRLMARGSGRWGRVTTLATMFGPENSFTGLADVRVWVQPTGAVTVAWMYDFTVGHSDYAPIYERTLSPRTGRWGHRVTVASNSDGVLFSLTGARDGELTACFQDFVTTLAPGASKWSALLDISVKGWTFELGGYDEAAVSNLDGTTVAAWSVYTSGGTAPQGYGLYVSVRQDPRTGVHPLSSTLRRTSISMATTTRCFCWTVTTGFSWSRGTGFRPRSDRSSRTAAIQLARRGHPRQSAPHRRSLIRSELLPMGAARH